MAVPSDYRIAIERHGARLRARVVHRPTGRRHYVRGRYETEAAALAAARAKIAELCLIAPATAAEALGERVADDPEPPPAALPKIPRGDAPPLDAAARLATTSALVISDLHVPYHNADLLQRAIDLKNRRFPEVDQLIIAGDLFDFASISRHPKDGREAAINDELKTAGAVLRELLRPFSRAYILPGNHDERLAKKLEAHVPMRFLIDGCLGGDRPDCEIITTEYDYVYLDHPEPERQWIIGHPSHYSGQGGRTPAQIAELEHRNCMTGHNHVIGLSQSPSGRYIGVDIGHMTDPHKHLYVRRRLTKYPRWSAGFAVIVDGYAHPFYERFTNWRIT